jgi:hypothetical protein
MKTEHERERLIKDINELLNQADDSTLDEIYALLLKIEDEEVKAYDKAKKNADIERSVSWEEAKKELETSRKKEVA